MGTTIFGFRQHIARKDKIVMQYLLGLDLGSSSIKGSLLDIDSGICIASSQFPKEEMSISAPELGWAEQEPDDWWRETVNVIRDLTNSVDGGLKGRIAGIGISYQMHGLVCLDSDGKSLRPSIIWCDSRAVSQGEKAFDGLGREFCLEHLLNSPGNFTASKLAWVKEHEPEVFSKIHKICLPGDYIAYRLSGQVNTTLTGLSEGVFYDFKNDSISDRLLDFYNIEQSILAETVEVFSVQSTVESSVAHQLGLSEGIPISYRAGDQPNNALSLGVLEPGQVAATGGTSGVVYGVSSSPQYDVHSRVNTFLHVNHRIEQPRYGVLMCINGCGIQNSWLKQTLGAKSYDEMNALASEADLGASGLRLYPFGNGAERTLNNLSLGSSLLGLDLNQHDTRHLLRASQEGIVFAMINGVDIMRGLGVEPDLVRAGNANMFLSPLFCEAFVNLCGGRLEIMETDGSLGAARGAGIGCGVYSDAQEAFVKLEPVRSYNAEPSLRERYVQAYGSWKNGLSELISQSAS